jgi:hypothetical protein
MLARARERVLESLRDDDVVLDVGGWADPFGRADWVIDIMPYETRGLYQREGWAPASPDRERFGRETWIQRDVCDREPYPFGDDEFDFVVCSHTLEDVRDPIWVCSELCRIARAGYIEVPSRLEEQSWGVKGAFVGWSHHRWLIEIADREIEFVAKPHELHSVEDHHFPAGFWEGLNAEERVQTLLWEGRFAYRERVIMDPREHDDYLAVFVARELAARPRREQSTFRNARSRLRQLRDRASAGERPRRGH